MKKIKKFLVRLLIIVIVLGIGALVFISTASFSSGYRAGVPIKMSHKGVLFKTWEGQLNIGGLTNSDQGAIPTTWEFSIAEDEELVRNKIDQAITQGKRVKLNYKEKYIKLFWKGDTKYLVYEV
jgi:sulfopyruvate decarboxylase TPP-binding subunit